MKATILVGDALEQLRELPDESVHCVVTSPPYWGLRNYGIPASVWPVQRSQGVVRCSNGDHLWGDPITQNSTNHTDKRRWQHTRNGRDEEQPPEKRVAWLHTEVPQGEFCSLCGAWAGCFGLEPTPELFVEHAVTIFREVRRVLRSDGTLFLNMGDSYSSHPGQRVHNGDGMRDDVVGWKQATNIGSTSVGSRCAPGLKPKDLVGMPWRLAFALQADGWYLRSDIIWSKPNPMPESVTDRPTKAHEYIFLLTKSSRYFYDAEAVKEPVTGEAHARGNGVNPKATKHGQHSRMEVDRDPRHLKYNGKNEASGDRKKVGFKDRWDQKEATRSRQNESFSGAVAELVYSRNKRSVWTIATQPFSEAHFATFPEEIPETCILAGTSEKGCCLACGAPWERMTEATGGTIGRSWHDHSTDATTGQRIADPAGKGGRMQDASHGRHGCAPYEVKTIGWQPTCDCEGPQKTVPCKVLDPFCGAGTTGVVALRYHRDFVGIELNPEYAAMAQKRIKNDAPMFNEVSHG